MGQIENASLITNSTLLYESNTLQYLQKYIYGWVGLHPDFNWIFWIFDILESMCSNTILYLRTWNVLSFRLQFIKLWQLEWSLATIHFILLLLSELYLIVAYYVMLFEMSCILTCRQNTGVLIVWNHMKCEYYKIVLVRENVFYLCEGIVSKK